MLKPLRLALVPVLIQVFAALPMNQLAAQTTAPATASAPTEAAIRAKGAKLLGAADFEARYVGNTLSGKTADGEEFHVFVESKSGYRMLFQGKRTADRWSVGPAGEFCSSDGKDTTCTREYDLDQTIYSFNGDGTLAGTAKIRPGNPEKL